VLWPEPHDETAIAALSAAALIEIRFGRIETSFSSPPEEMAPIL
jgi:hypothetical protein